MGDRVTILHLGEGESRQAWKEALADRPWESGTLIKKDGGRSVWRANLLGSRVSVKVRPAHRLRTTLRVTEYRRAVTATILLARAGIETPRVFLHGLVGQSEVLVHEWLEGPTLLARLVGASGPERRALCSSAGKLVGVTTANGLFNRDCKPSNIIVTANDVSHLAIVDIGGVRVPAFMTVGGLVQNLARMLSSLAIEPAGVGEPLGESELNEAIVAACASALGIRKGVSSESLVRRVTGRVHDLIASQGDATPRVNPLDPPQPTEPRA